MAILVVGQATGQHGWSSLEAWASGALALKRDAVTLRPRAPWNAETLTDADGLDEQLARRGHDPIILCGFDWHSQPLHRDPRRRDALRAWPGPRIGLFQEHLGAAWVRRDSRRAQAFDDAVRSAVECLTHVVCHHEADVDHLRALGVRIPVVFLPFCADASVFQARVPWNRRDTRAFFRGKRLSFMGANPYADREHLIETLRGHEDFVLEWTDPDEDLGADERVARYVADLNRHALQLNLPSVSDSLTCRPFEVMACGGLLLQSPVEGEISRLVLPPQTHLLFERHDPANLAEAVRAARGLPQEAHAIAQAGQRHVLTRHDAATRVRQMLGWATGALGEAALVRELTARDSDRLVPVGAAARRLSDARAAPTVPRHREGRVLVDLVFFQHERSGIAQVWNRLLHEWARLGHAGRFVLVRRAGSRHAPPPEVLAAYEVVEAPAHGGANDPEVLQALCDRHAATLFISTYYSAPSRTPSLLLVHDCIPERVDPGFMSQAPWAEKCRAIERADAYLCISRTTADDLRRFHGPAVAGKRVYVAHNTFPDRFEPPPAARVDRFLVRAGCRAGYLLFVGERSGYLDYKNVETVCRALGELARQRPDLPNRHDLVFLGGRDGGDPWTLEPHLERHLSAWSIRRLSVADEDVPYAYAAAALTVYPSLIEGFGLPPGESLACGTPALVWKSPINDEVYPGLVAELDPSRSVGIDRQLLEILDQLPQWRERVPGAARQLRERAQARGGATQAGVFLELLLLHAQRGLDWSDPSLVPLLFDAPPSERADWLRRLIDGHPDEVTGSGLRLGEETLRSAAIVSIYDGPRFMRGCVDDLVAQSDFLAGRMEVLLIDSASPGGEHEELLPRVRATPGLRYLRTVERESLYRAWNRGARCARSRYLSNANLDDRHRSDFFERLGDVLDAEPPVQLVYPAQYLTTHANEPFADHLPERSWGWPEYSLSQLRMGNHVGSQPMWRRELHGRIGDFDEGFRIAGDYDYWCRIAHEAGPLRLHPVHLGLYYFNAQGIEHGDPLRSEREVARICERYGIPRNYVTSENDRARSQSDTPAPRSLEDLQYAGIELTGQVNVVIPVIGNLDAALRVADAVLSQGLAIRRRLQILLTAPHWSEAEVRSVNDGRLRPLTTQIRVARDPSAALGFEQDAPTARLHAAPSGRDALEVAMRALEADPARRHAEVPGHDAPAGILMRSLPELLNGANR